MQLHSKIFISLALAVASLAGSAPAMQAADPTATSYSFDQCRGSALPYEAPDRAYDYPDSLTPVFINHVGRHGARYPSSSKHASNVRKALEAAEAAGTLTDRGRRLSRLVDLIEDYSAGRWGALDSVGIAEQWGIAARMYANFPQLFASNAVVAESSYVPRCVMSMYSFLHQVTRLDNHVETDARSGRRFSPLLRFFDTDADYREFAAADTWRKQYDDYCTTENLTGYLPTILGRDFDLATIDAPSVALSAYSLVASTAAMGLDIDPAEYFTLEEFNRAWRCFNLRQYLLHSASTISAVPAEAASPLLSELIDATDAAFSNFDTKGTKGVALRFGHAETLMPLFALMQLRQGYYLTNYFDTVALHWHDFEIVPMGANLQIILFKSSTGRNYVRIDLNEHPVAPIAGSDRIYVPWSELRAHFERLIPIYR